MQQPYRVIIADTSCIILLDKIDSLEILHQLFGEVTTTDVVSNEFGKPLPEWISIEHVNNIAQQSLFEKEVDKGEASAIALAIEKINSLLILDDFKARKLATKLHLHFTGTLGVLLKAKEAGIIFSLKPILEKIQRTNFRFTDKIFDEILRSANEI